MNSRNVFDWPMIAIMWCWSRLRRLVSGFRSQNESASSQPQDRSLDFIGEHSVEMTFLRNYDEDIDPYTLKYLKQLIRNNFFYEPQRMRFYDVLFFADQAKNEGLTDDPNAELITVSFTAFIEEMSSYIPMGVTNGTQWIALIMQKIHDQLYSVTPWEDDGQGCIRYKLSINGAFIDRIPQTDLGFPNLLELPIEENSWSPEFH